MEYQKYIDLGFERTDLNCSVEFKQKLYIKKNLTDSYHIIPITPKVVIDLFSKECNANNFTNAC